MKVLVACEFSGIVREAFSTKGHDAWSCDLLDTEIPGQHIKDDVRKHLHDGWDLVVAHPPCTYLAVSGARWFKERRIEQREAIEFFLLFTDLPDVEMVAIENPVSIMSTRYRKPDQIVQPWMFGHGETKSTCLWLKGIPRLTPTDIVDGRNPKVHYESPGPNRWKNRSRTKQGIAQAMAEQWGRE